MWFSFWLRDEPTQKWYQLRRTPTPHLRESGGKDGLNRNGKPGKGTNWDGCGLMKTGINHPTALQCRLVGVPLKT